MNHQCSASTGKDGVRIISERDIGRADGALGFSIGVNLEIRRVTGMWTLRIVQAVLFSVGIEMRSG